MKKLKFLSLVSLSLAIPLALGAQPPQPPSVARAPLYDASGQTVGSMAFRWEVTGDVDNYILTANVVVTKGEPEDSYSGQVSILSGNLEVLDSLPLTLQTNRAGMGRAAGSRGFPEDWEARPDYVRCELTSQQTGEKITSADIPL